VGTASDPKASVLPAVEFKVRAVSIAWAPALVASMFRWSMWELVRTRFQEGWRYFREDDLVHSDVLRPGRTFSTSI